MRRYQTSEMGNVIKYRTNVVLYFIFALVFAIKISRNAYELYLHRSCITDGLDSRLFYVSCQQPWLRLVELQNHTYHLPVSLS